MSIQTVTLELPESVYRLAERTARATKRAVEAVLIDALKITLPPPLDNVPTELRKELEGLESLSDTQLLKVAKDRLAAARVRQYDQLLLKNQKGTISQRERERLTKLRQVADRIMLRRAHAYVLLKWRGYNRAMDSAIQSASPEMVQT